MQYQDIKREVSTQLGKTNYSTADVIRDEAIKRARKEFYQKAKWIFLKKKSTLTFASGEALFPTDYNPMYDLGQIYSYDGNLKKEYSYVQIEDVNGHLSDDPVFAIDFGSKKILSNLDGEVNITYYFLPDESPTDTYEEPCLNSTAVTLLAIAEYWLAKERDEENYDRFYSRYKEVLGQLLTQNEYLQPIRKFKKDTTNYGF